jgi:hypothetical protein
MNTKSLIRKEEYILSCYRNMFQEYKKLVGIEIKQNTYEKFVYVGKLRSFIKWQFKIRLSFKGI